MPAPSTLNKKSNSNSNATPWVLGVLGGAALLLGAYAIGKQDVNAYYNYGNQTIIERDAEVNLYDGSRISSPNYCCPSGNNASKTITNPTKTVVVGDTTLSSDECLDENVVRWKDATLVNDLE